MNLAELSIRRPIFITCIIIVMLALGLLSMRKLPVDLFPDVTFPVVIVDTIYPGAGPSEIETLVSRPLEDEISTLSGIKRLSSVNLEGLSRVIAEFALETDVKYAEQQIRDRVSATRIKFPSDVKQSVIRRIDPADQPVISMSVTGDLSEAKLYDVADQVIRPKLEQINKVGLVEVLGGRKREVHIKLDRRSLKDRELSASTIVSRLGLAGENIPLGKQSEGNQDINFRTLGEFKSLEDIRRTVVNFFGNDVPVQIRDVGSVVDTLEDERTRVFVNGKKSLFVYVYRQSGSNTIEVADAIKKRIAQLNAELKREPGAPVISEVRDTSVWIRANVDDVKESILIGIVLAVIVVYFFLANGRSTIITGLALPNSLIGAFILMSVAGFSINIMSLLALSLSVGLLIDDAIVVRENIFRHLEMGKTPEQAAKDGTAEVRLAVIATTLAVIAVFAPVAFLKGVVGQFFKQFGATICFAMAISLFDALTIAPMLSAYFAGATHVDRSKGIWNLTVGRLVTQFERFQVWLENGYERLLHGVIKHPLLTLFLSTVVFVASCSTVVKVPKTFLPQQDAGEFALALDLPPGTNIETTTKAALAVDAQLRKNPEIAITALTVGGRNGEANTAEFYVHLTPGKERKENTGQVKERVREQMKAFAYASPKVKDYDAVGGGQRPFNVNIIGFDQQILDKLGLQLYEALKKNPSLRDVDTSYRPGKPEFQVKLLDEKAKALGVSSKLLGMELRTQVEGVPAAKLREEGREYDIRIRLEDEQRNLKKDFNKVFIPNINQNLVRLSDVAAPVNTLGASTISRQDRGRYVQVSADIAAGAGLGDVMNEVKKLFETEIKLPPGFRYAFVGQAENFAELGESMATAMGLGTLFIFLVLASLYESFVTPLTIMLALPLAICGSFVSLFLAKESLNIFSMIGMIMLLGVATKNSILLVDYAQQLIEGGKSRAEALVIAGKTRLRPILMTTMALIAGTIPIAAGLNEASKQRTSMGWAIIGGLISSTLLTLVVIPAAFSYIDRFRLYSQRVLARIFMSRS